MGESIKQFIDRQNRRVARLDRDAEAVAHEGYRKAIRAGQDLRLSSPSEVARHGVKLLQDYEGRAEDAVSRAAKKAKLQVEDALRRTGENPVAKAVAIGAAHRAGNVAGVVRSGVHAVEGLVGGATVINRLLDPVDVLKSPPGESAQEQLGRGALNAGRMVTDYVQKGMADPASVAADATEMTRQWRRDLDTSATPAAPTFEGELRRNFDIGQNQGELATEVGLLAFGGAAAKTAETAGVLSKEAALARYLKQGASPKRAAYLARTYDGMGSHFFPRRLGLPKFFTDSSFNVKKPEGITTGQMHELHFENDTRFHGARLGAEAGPGGWSGRKLGLETNGLAGRIWYGSPAPLKAAVGRAYAATGLANYNGTQERKPW